MFVARVTGSVVATQKVASMTGHKLLTVEPYRVDEKSRDRLVPTGRTFVVVDTLGAGLDEMVLICQGSSARLTPETEKLPIDAVVIGLVDTVDVGGKTIFSTRDDTADDPTIPGPFTPTVPAMQMTEDLIRNVVQQVLAQMGAGGRRRNGTAPQRRRARTASIRRPTPPSAAAEAAFQPFRTRPLADRKKAVERIRKICVEQAEELGRLELEETEDRPARPQDRQAPRRDPDVPGVEYLRTDNYSGDDGLTLTDYAPFGVIGAITPVTHSLPTLAGNAINMLAAGNTVVFNAHPSGAKIAAEGVRRFNRAIRQAIGLDDLLTIIDPPTLESAAALFDHRGVKLLVVTGGPAVARAALASKRRAIVAGPGNPPVVVDATACLDNAAKSIVDGRGVRQQPALHRREAGLRRRRDLRQADGGNGPQRRLPAQRLSRSTP